MSPKLALITAVSLAASLLIMHPAQAELYNLTVLGTGGPAGNSSSYADGINNLGVIVGGIAGADGNYQAAIFSGSTITPLGTLGGPTSSANAVNDLGQVVGQSDLDSNGHSGAFYYDMNVGGPLTNLGAIPVGTAFQTGSANAINNAGVIVGYGTNTLNEGRAVEYYANGSAPTDLGLADPNQGSVANAVSNNGSIAGNSFIDNNTPAMHAATFNNGGVQFENDLTTNAGNSSFINGINDLGVATGYGQIGVYGNNHALVFTNGNVMDIGTLGGVNGNSYGQAINATGTVVGYSEFTDSNGNFDIDGFVYIDGVMQDLNDSLVSGTDDPFTSLQFALGINNAGEIVGYGELADGEYQGFLLTPAVPEPATLSLLLIGGTLMGGRRKRKSK